MKKKTAIKIIISLFSAVIIFAAVYAGYVLLSYSRIEDNLEIQPSQAGISEEVKIGEKYTAVTQNLGFGAYTQDFTFFMDGGKESRAKSKESVLECINSAADKALSFEADFVLFQEVDFGSTRSYGTNQREILENRFEKYSGAFAVNYDSPYLMYPIFEPHGASKSGILTLSKLNITSSLRRSLPVSTGFSKILDLDRCYSVSRIPTDNGKELVIYNTHFSAYGGSDEIRKGQMNMLFGDMKAEYEKGNYCVCGGDFNHDFTGDSTQKLNGGQSMDFGWAMPFPIELLPDCIERCISYEDDTLVPTCRNCDIPYKEGNFTVIVDGFLITENVEAVSVRNIKTDFVYSDHNPVVLEFILK